MKKAFLSLTLVAMLALSGCSDNSGIFTSNYSGNALGSSQIISEHKKAEFYERCDNQNNQFISSQNNAGFSEINCSVSSVQYEDGNCFLSKIYVFKSGDSTDSRMTVGYIDIYSEDEYDFFKAAKGFICFVKENAIDISGRSNFSIVINPKKDAAGNFYDISVLYSDGSSSIDYSSRKLRSAYSERFKSIEFLEGSRQSLSLLGLIDYDDVSKIYDPFSISTKLQEKVLSHTWYKVEEDKEDTVFVTYIDDGTYGNMADDELVYYAFSVANELSKTEPYLSDITVYFANKSNKDKIACSLHYYQAKNRIQYSNCTWFGEYERLNENSLHIYLEKLLKGEADV